MIILGLSTHPFSDRKFSRKLSTDDFWTPSEYSKSLSTEFPATSRKFRSRKVEFRGQTTELYHSLKALRKSRHAVPRSIEGVHLLPSGSSEVGRCSFEVPR